MIGKVPNPVAPGASPAIDAGKQKFGKLLESAKPNPSQVMLPETALRPPAQPPEVARATGVSRAAPGKCEVKPGSRVDSAQQARAKKAAQVLDGVTAAQQRLDKVLALAKSGKTFTPAELLALQADVYRSSQALDLAGKVVEKATSGVKQVLQTQI